MTRLIDRLRARAAERFVGRESELALVRESLALDPPRVAVFFVHGPGGVGKTSLLERVRALAASHGIDSLRLDARDIEPAPHGVLSALGAALGLAAGDATLACVVERWSQQPRRLLVIDTFECIAHLDGWLRETLLPELPDTTRVVIAARVPPDPAWTSDALWREGARVIGLRNLAASECARYLDARAIPLELHERIVRTSHGHPLALTLLADIAAARGELPAQLGPDVVRRLAERFTAHVPTELHRRALEVCAHARITTEPLLVDAVDCDHARELFDWLASLSFIEHAPGGLFPHDLVRDAIDDELHWRNRERHREVHVAVHQHLLKDVARNARRVFDIMFLNRHSPALQPFVDFRALGSVYFEPAGADDLAALRALMSTELPASQHATVEHWFAHRATRTWVARLAPGELVAATLSIDLALLDDAERASDPVFAAVWRAFQDAGSMRPNDHQLLARWNLAQGGQRRPSAAMNALQMSQFHEWLTLPRLGAFVICVEQPDHWRPMMSHIGFVRMPACDRVVDALPLGCYVHDWRAVPPGPWLGSMAARTFARPTAPFDAAITAPQRLARPDFERAVRDALRLYHDATALAANPLVQCDSVRAAASDGEAPVDTLRRLLLEQAQALRARPRDAKFWRALELTYFRPAGSQELAAERLALPFGTYRYQLATGIERVVQTLWTQETG
ncbi:ATP-binding protein [Aquincola sp. S2]|uniref:ATP-binding protein n=1 Tax=Pseudaquabacterium terrae TaxID=2732868 RepID=A0ABX2EQ77_9BURK|nr:ATP-binding protein [Aquabacterium terrae]NRF70753.1 ATP-binding protein [Aquabacterium terrae]